MPQETTPKSTAPWIISVAVAAFAIGVATSDTIRNIVFYIQDAIMTYKGGNIPQVLTGLPPQAQSIPPSTFTALSVVPPESIADIKTASEAFLLSNSFNNYLVDIRSTGLYYGKFKGAAIPYLPPGLPESFGTKPNSHAHR